jgi:phosphoglycolate phosphatase-like HAD superfamily hydrolase
VAGVDVVLFDIDGTLIDTGGAGARSWRHAFDKLYGIPADIGEFTSAGMTDPEVARGTFRAAIGREPSREELARLFAAYLLRLSDEIIGSEGYRTLSGVDDTLRRLGERGLLLGIVSGAMEGAARIKLSRARLNRYFLFGGYGSDSPNRVALTNVAIARATTIRGHELAPSSVMVVGDTPLDVEAARGVGAVSVAVASGKYGIDELRAAAPDHILESLEDEFPSTGSSSE